MAFFQLLLCYSFLSGLSLKSIRIVQFEGMHFRIMCMKILLPVVCSLAFFRFHLLLLKLFFKDSFSLFSLPYLFFFSLNNFIMFLLILDQLLFEFVHPFINPLEFSCYRLFVNTIFGSRFNKFFDFLYPFNALIKHKE